MKSRSCIPLVLVFGLAFVLTGTAAAQPVPPGSPISQVFSRAENSPSVINRSVYLPLIRTSDPLLYDDFNNPAFDGAYDPTLWNLADGAAGYKGEQQAGAFVFSNDPAVTPAWSCANLMMTKPQQRNVAQLQLFEARLRLASDLSGGRHEIRLATDFTALPRLGYTAPQVTR